MRSTIVAEPGVELASALRRTGALLEGHFILSSGRHSSHYVQCARLLSWPQHAEQAGAAIAARVRDLGVQVVVGPALGGILVAHEVARALGVRCLFAERTRRESPAAGSAAELAPLRLRRGFEILAGERALVVEDVVTTGGSARETAELVEQSGGVVAGFAAIVDRSASGQDEAPGAGSRVPATARRMPGTDLALHALERLEFETFEPSRCPLCEAGLAAIKPGSRR